MIAHTIDGSTVIGGHTIPLGAQVRVTKGGVVQAWGEVRVLRHDRNRTYRLQFTNGTYVTAHEDELTVVPDALPGATAIAHAHRRAYSRTSGTKTYAEHVAECGACTEAAAK